MRNEPEQRQELSSDAATARQREQDELLGSLQVGERVTAVLESANRAAEDTLAQARREADRLRAEAEDEASATLADAQREAQEVRRETEQLRAEAKRYGTETRQAADVYAEEKRLGADEAAARTLSEAEERARKVGKDAARKARQSDDEARTRQAAIVAESGRFEDRLQNLLTVFRGMTEQLEDLLGKRAEAAAGPLETLQESLEEPIKGKSSTLPSS